MNTTPPDEGTTPQPTGPEAAQPEARVINTRSYLSSQWNHAATFLRMYFNDVELSTGSGFFWRRVQRTFLITNWHNLSGRNPQTEAPISPTAAIPDSVGLSLFARTGQAIGRFNGMRQGQLTLPLRTNNAPRWLEHPSRRLGVDVAALEITHDIPQDCTLLCANQIEGDAEIEPAAAQQVFVLGYPFGMIAGAPGPIWKRGTIAVDPSYDIDDLPKLMIDTATREGMSGSVVLARHDMINRSYPQKSGKVVKSFHAQLDLVIGVYSGRLFPDLERAQLGVVWKRRVIDEIINAQIPAQI